jgi:hypothetical protein
VVSALPIGYRQCGFAQSSFNSLTGLVKATPPIENRPGAEKRSPVGTSVLHIRYTPLIDLWENKKVT